MNSSQPVIMLSLICKCASSFFFLEFNVQNKKHMVDIIILINIQTRIVPRTICEFVSRILLHEKHSFSLHSWPYSWELHLLSGGCIEVAVSPDVGIKANSKMKHKTPENETNDIFVNFPNSSYYILQTKTLQPI